LCLFDATVIRTGIDRSGGAIHSEADLGVRSGK
jgi:hypothetical protein